MTERVEAIRRELCEMINPCYPAESAENRAWVERIVDRITEKFSAALAQAERERDEFKEVFRQQSALTEELTQKWDAFRADVERLKEQLRKEHVLRVQIEYPRLIAALRVFEQNHANLNYMRDHAEHVRKMLGEIEAALEGR